MIKGTGSLSLPRSRRRFTRKSASCFFFTWKRKYYQVWYISCSK